MSDHIPYPITTEAGKRLWVYLNQHHGSGTWGLAGKLIPQIEQEARQRKSETDKTT